MNNLEELVNLSLRIGNRTYNVPIRKDVYPLIDKCIKTPPFILGSIVRGQTLKSHIVNQFSLWTALCLDLIEPELLDWIDKIEEDSVLFDLGASTGPFSIYAASKGIKVVSFEPEAQNYSMLEMNHFLNKENFKHPILSFNIAISDEHGMGKIYCANYSKGAHEKILDQPKHVTGNEKFISQHAQTVVKYPLDDVIENLALPKPQYLKIDVDGAEEQVLNGADKILKSGELKEIFIELTESDQSKKLVDKIESYGFKMSSKHQVEDYKGLYNWIFSHQQ